MGQELIENLYKAINNKPILCEIISTNLEQASQENHDKLLKDKVPWDIK